MCGRNVKYDRFVAIRCVFSSSKYSNTRFRPPPLGGAYDAPPDTLVGWRGGHSLLLGRGTPLGCVSSVVSPSPQHKFLATPMDPQQCFIIISITTQEFLSGHIFYSSIIKTGALNYYMQFV